ncbi:hypothetical protein J6590_038635 [Homalodisca vitripennis]|nr:hypothetical protein J6590_038635 [Homalodisca vitripennis]
MEAFVTGLYGEIFRYTRIEFPKNLRQALNVDGAEQKNGRQKRLILRKWSWNKKRSTVKPQRGTLKRSWQPPVIPTNRLHTLYTEVEFGSQVSHAADRDSLAWLSDKLTVYCRHLSVNETMKTCACLH